MTPDVRGAGRARHGLGTSCVVRARRVDAPLLVAGLPSSVAFGFLGKILPTSTTSEVAVQLHRVPRTEAIEMLHSASAVAHAELASGEGGVDGRPAQLALESESAEELGQRVAAREQELWRVGLSFHALGTNRTRAERIRTEIARRLQAIGFRPRVPTFGADEVVGPPDLAGTEPRPPAYWHVLHSDGAAAFFPFLDETVAEAGGVLVGLLLDDASPVFLERFSHASYSWGIFGATGSGKSFGAALTVLRSVWMRPDLAVFVLDPLGEFAGLAGPLGADLVTFGPNEATRVNPLDPSTTGGDGTEKAARVVAFVRGLFPSLRDEEAAQLDAGLHALYHDPGAASTWSALLDRLPPAGTSRLPGLLEVFRSGSLAYLDGPSTARLDRGSMIVNLAGVAPDHLAFHTMFLLDAVVGAMRARPGPKLLVLDEAHLLARPAANADLLDRIVRLVRHFDAGVLLLTQNPDDLLASESGRSILRNLRASMLLHLSEVSPECRRFFQLTEPEADWLPRARLPREAGYAEGLLRFGPSHLPIALVASTPEYELISRCLGRTPASPRS
ncbi:MAG: VirB4 family type IV secretion system protein [Thermoplasmata archaeon]